MKIQAAVLFEPRKPFEILDLDLADPRPGEVLVRIAAAGVCHSDYHLVSGATKHPMPVVAGHEGAGIVESIGPGVTSVRPGDHVILNWAPDCGRCFYCDRGKPNLCDTYTGPIWAGTMLDGTTRLTQSGRPVYHYCGLASFATHAVVPEQSCVGVRKDVPLTVAALVGCAVATGVGAALYTAQVRPGDSVAVYGCGGVGLSILQGAKLCGARTLIAIDKAPEKMEIARRFGATHALPAGPDTLAAIRAATGGRGVDHAFEAVGLPAVQEAALDAVRPGGNLILAGLSPMGTGTNLPGALLTRQEKTVKGSYYGSVHPRRDFPLLVELYKSGRLDLDQLISKQYTLPQINEAYADMLAGRIARGVIVL
ncbi:MAG TPA: Zn-dependent alcohol dehydrogenase [Tepidisphaeraceae bacterium]|jgi:S-(hydroxymethyl)glutathione dehydrogenase/alcohol dehydrogenase|nr:Zn-dependent alcohol dehydrogenase [Tepidisphaeraceae bacterium]